MVSASSFSSSSGPWRLSRSCRLVAEIRRAVAAMARTGGRKRPATSQPNMTETAAMTPRAMPDRISSCPRSEPWMVTPGEAARPVT